MSSIPLNEKVFSDLLHALIIQRKNETGKALETLKASYRIQNWFGIPPNEIVELERYDEALSIILEFEAKK